MFMMKLALLSLCGFAAFIVLVFCTYLKGFNLDNSALDAPNQTFRVVSVLVDDKSRSADPSNNLIVLYNRVPKTGSTSFTGIAYDLCGRNKFNVLHLNTSKNSHVLSLSDQFRFAQNITRWTEKHPALFHGHLAWFDFAAFGVERLPLFINIVRDPIDRLVSYYYFLRYGDDFRPYLSRRRQGDRKSIDECVAEQGKDCDPMNMWLQGEEEWIDKYSEKNINIMPFFCGHAISCWEPPGNLWALAEAKRNLMEKYFLVGVTEEMEDFISLLEAALPSMFRGASDLYLNGDKSHLRKTFNKTMPLPHTTDNLKLSPIYKAEAEFYQFAYEQFQAVKRRTLVAKADRLVDRGQQYFFEKIRPRNRENTARSTSTNGSKS